MEKCKYCNENGIVVVSTDSRTRLSGWPRPGGWAPRPGWLRPGWSRPGWPRGPRPGWPRYNYDRNVCKYCEGTGIQKYQDCPTCDGTGYIFYQNHEAKVCHECAGLGKVEMVHSAIRVAEPIL